MRLVNPGTKFWFDGSEFMRTESKMLIDKVSVNCVCTACNAHDPDSTAGVLCWLDVNTAVEVEVAQ
jgi:hypothetical protein